MLVDVSGDRNGHGESLAHHDALFVHRLVLIDVHPSQGSIAGGTLLTLVGDGFSADLQELAVHIGHVPCQVTRARAEELVCITGAHAASEDNTYDLSHRLVSPGSAVLPSAVGVFSRGMQATCEGACEFTYHVASTPLLDPHCLSAQIQPDYSWVIALCGTNFVTPSSRNRIWVGGSMGSACTPQTGNSTFIRCLAPALQTGTYAVRLFADGYGFAASTSVASVPTFTAPLIVGGSSPHVTIVTGGATVTITGTGFAAHDHMNVVSICGRACAVTSSTATVLTCIAPSVLPYPEASRGGLLKHQTHALARDDVRVVPSSAVSGEAVAVQASVTVAFAFRGVALPQGSVPTQALIKLPALQSAGAISLRIRAALVSCSTSFSLEHEASLSVLPGETVSSVTWEPPLWGTAHDAETPDVSILLAELTNRSNWQSDGSCVAAFSITHTSGDGVRTFVAGEGISLRVSYELPSPLSQLETAGGSQCGFSLAIDSAIVSPQSESYAMVHSIGRRLSVSSAAQPPDSALEPTVPTHRRRVSTAACSASGWHFSDALSGLSISTPALPTAIEIEATPSACVIVTEGQPAVTGRIWPNCSGVSTSTASTACSTAWHTCSVKLNGVAVITGTPVEPTHPAGGICATSLTPDTLEVTGSGCWKTHLSGFQIDLFGRFVSALPVGHLVVLVSCGLPWFKSGNFDQFYLPSRVDELFGILTTVGFPPSRAQMTNSEPISMVGVKGGTPRVGRVMGPLVFRAEPSFFHADVMGAPMWHVEQRWRHNNLQPHPSAFAADMGLGLMKKLDAAVETFLWPTASSSATTFRSHLAALQAQVGLALDAMDLQTTVRCPSVDEVMRTRQAGRWTRWQQSTHSRACACRPDWVVWQGEGSYQHGACSTYSSGAALTPCCLRGEDLPHTLPPRVPKGAIEWCTHWSGGAQQVCGSWGWRGQLSPPDGISHCSVEIHYGCASWSSTSSSSMCPQLVQTVHNASFWRNNPLLWSRRSHGNDVLQVEEQCSDTCNYASDGDCDDGGSGSEYSICSEGSDCVDCGLRGGHQSGGSVASSTTLSGEWYADEEYQPKEHAGQLTPHLSAALRLLDHGLPLVEQMLNLTHGVAGAELRLAAAAAANALAAGAPPTEAAIDGYVPCATEKAELLDGRPYAPWCRQARLEQALRTLETDVKRLNDKLQTAPGTIEFDNSLLLRCWRVAATEAAEHFDFSSAGPPNAEERVTGINFEWSVVKKTVSQTFRGQDGAQREKLWWTVSNELFEDRFQSGYSSPRVSPMSDDWTIGGVQFDENFVCQAAGEFVAPVQGVATFLSEADDGAVLRIDDTVVLDNGGHHGPRVTRADFHFTANRTYRVEHLYYQRGRGKTWKLFWMPPEEPRCRVLPPSPPLPPPIRPSPLLPPSHRHRHYQRHQHSISQSPRRRLPPFHPHRSRTSPLTQVPL